MQGKTEKLEELLRGQSRLLVAYSGGVDSAFLLWKAVQVLGDRVQGVLADSPSLAREEKDLALAFAGRHGLPVRVIETREMENPDYRANPANRCFFCKHELFERMNGLALAEGYSAIAYGENADDAHEDRPGQRAASTFSVLAPLREAGWTKSDVRSGAGAAGLEVAEKVAQPCLASRIPHGLEVTPEKLRQVESAESVVRGEGFRIVRVRHLGSRALVQVGPAETAQLRENQGLQDAIAGRLKTLGFAGVDFDPLGYQGAALR